MSFYIIQPPTPERVKYDIFDRVNRGGTKLNSQEMRNALYRGASTQLIKEIADSEVFVMTSDYEGIPNALIEAMMIGMPVVSTDCSPGGAKLLIKDNYNGIIVKQGDSKEVSDAVIRIFSSPELKKHLSQNAEKLDEDFLPDKIIKQI